MDQDRYDRAIERIFGLQFFGIKLGLVNIRRLLGDLGNPQENFQVVLVAGTNGKGSTASTLASICTEAGMTCGLFTSPHLIRFNERFTVNRQQITDEQVLDLSDAIWRFVDRRQQREDPEGPSPITFFEFATAMACEHFRRQKCDLAVFECGLGGRLDATNALEPILDIFTPISFDHTQFLGETLASIAGEKAGILRAGVPAVMSNQPEEALLTLEDRLAHIGAPGFLAGRDFGIQHDGDQAVFWDAYGKLKPVETTLPGAYQLENTSLALAAARILQHRGMPISDQAILSGPHKVFWPGRLEKVADDPIVILDGAHNEAAAKLLARTLAATPVTGKTVAVLSIMGDKDIAPIVRGFAPAFDAVITTKTSMPRTCPPEVLTDLVRQYVPQVFAEPSLDESLIRAKEIAGPDGRVVICGSLFLVGEVRAKIFGEKGQGPNGEWVGLRG